MCVYTLLVRFLFFFFNAPATTEIYTLSLHDALPIYLTDVRTGAAGAVAAKYLAPEIVHTAGQIGTGAQGRYQMEGLKTRSEEHTSELQSHSDLVCRLLLEKKKNKKKKKKNTSTHE